MNHIEPLDTLRVEPLHPNLTLRDIIEAYDKGILTKETAGRAAEALFMVRVVVGEAK